MRFEFEAITFFDLVYFYLEIMFRNFKLLLIVFFSMKYVNTIEGVCFVNETSLSRFESARSDVREVNDIPGVLVDIYHANSKGDGSLKESSKRSIPTVHGFMGQGNARFICCFLNDVRADNYGTQLLVCSKLSPGISGS